MKTGIFGGLWDVMGCEEKAKYVCKHWAEGVTRPPEPTTTPEPRCLETWGTTSKSSLCFKVRTNVRDNTEHATYLAYSVNRGVKMKEDQRNIQTTVPGSS